MVVAIYLNIHYIYTVQSKCKNFMFCGVEAPKSSRIQAVKKSSKYLNFDLKIGICIKCYVNFNIQSIF